ncbi:autotransporter domain-containing protein [Achromobacter sp. MY14]|uniref:autotransporter family protein n=1 Tax=Achromobacter TaxID=222 RepID=UPI000F8F841F|nr:MULTISPECIES: autotransporter outer membrane beta-barrel domain-containing protein [Achromobacter]AZS79338.1 autotransporter domain-containing protein [Achromobacter spanius]MCD0497585.1 autotransporter domain-containing protein [Achromobacter sp. MY14]
MPPRNRPSLPYRVLPALLLLGSTPVFAVPAALEGCSATGSVVALQCGPTEIELRGGAGTSSLFVEDVTASSVSLRNDPSVTTGPFVQNLSITGSTTLERNDYPAVFLNSSADDWSVNVKLGSGVTLRSAGLFGALWVRSESANTAFRNDIYIDSAATVVATGSDTVGITATSNNGKVTLINRGSVTSTQSRGLYADGGNVTKPDTVLIRNEGTVQAYQAAARAINYAGTSRIENTGSVRSTTAQGLVAWSNMGGAEIINSGTVVADNYDALVAGGTGADTLVYNSGTITANHQTVLRRVAVSGYSAIRAYTDGTGKLTVTNDATGVLNAASNAGMMANTELGSITLLNAGRIDARYGIQADSTGGAVSITNQGLINVTDASGAGVYVTAAAGGSLANSGTITSAGDTVRVDDGVKFTVNNEAGGVLAGGLSLGNQASLSNAGVVLLKQGADLNNPRNTGSSTSGKIGGNYTQTAGGTLRIAAASANDYSKLAVGGSAALGGTIDVDVKSSYVGGTLANVVTADGGVTNNGLALTDNSLRYAFSAVFGANGVDLAVRDTGMRSIQGAVDPRSPGASGAAAVFDQLLAQGTTSPELQRALDAFVNSSSAEEVSAAVQQTLPLLTGNGLSLANNTMNTVNGVVQSRIDATRGMASGDGFFSDRHAWIKPFGTHSRQQDQDGVPGYSADTGGLIIGVDGSVRPGTNLGLAFAYAHTDVSSNSSGPRQKADIDSYQLITYGSQALDSRSDVSFQLDGGRMRNKGQRDIDFLGLTANSRYDSKTVHAGVSVDRRFALSEQTVFAPALRLDYTWIKDDAYQEQGANGLGLQVKSRSTDALVLGLDGKFTHALSDRFNALANIGVGYDLYNRDASITSAFAGAPDAAFVTYGTKQSPWLVRAGAGLSYTTEGGTEITGRYDAVRRDRFFGQTASLRVRWFF